MYKTWCRKSTRDDKENKNNSPQNHTLFSRECVEMSSKKMDNILLCITSFVLCEWIVLYVGVLTVTVTKVLVVTAFVMHVVIK